MSKLAIHSFQIHLIAGWILAHTHVSGDMLCCHQDDLKSYEILNVNLPVIGRLPAPPNKRLKYFVLY